ncbi:MAG: BlaI/MecI/CopY family transcriptional regulator [Flavipsychrobacter sp.]|nr:BlaI/MecI/CopY family transcriptional regulator [Flavipsychrobacter sp.]
MSEQIKPTDSEVEILSILWEHGPASVRDVHDILSRKKDAGYTTTLKLMQIMLQKGLLERDETNRSHVYKAAVNKEQTQKQILKRIIDQVYNGSAAQLVMQALGKHETTSDELEQIKAYLEKIENKH